ncbi:hypothetical protein XENOCAPTIV_000052, partial [Xenoophorus captivus]
TNKTFLTWSEGLINCLLCCSEFLLELLWLEVRLQTTFSEFAMKHGRDPRFKAIDKMKDREAIFIEFMTVMRKRDKEDSKTRGEKVLLTLIWVLISPLIS